MRIIETCPECGHDLVNLFFATYSSTPQKKCYNCGWEWTGKREDKREEVVRAPFNPSDAGYNSSVCKYCKNNPENDGSGVCNCTLGQPKIT